MARPAGGRGRRAAGSRPRSWTDRSTRTLLAVRSALRPHRDRLWFRRLVRRGWIALAAVVVAELVLWTLARFVPLPWAPVVGAAIPVLGLLGLAGRRRSAPDRASARPRWPSTRRRDWATGSRAPSSWRSPSRRRPDRLGRRARCDARRRAARRRRRDGSIRPTATARRPGRGPPRTEVAVPTAVLASARRGRGRRAAPPRAGPPRPEPAGRGHRPAAAGPRGSRTTGAGHRPGRAGARGQGRGRQRSPDPACPGAARPRAAAPPAPERPRRQPRPPRSDRDRGALADRPGQRAACRRR